MAFSVRTSIDPNMAADKWSRKVEGAGTDLLTGYSRPRRDPQANADKSAITWLAKTTAAKGRYQTGIAGYDASAAVAAMQSVGVGRYTASATQKKAKVIKFHTAYDSVIASGMTSLPQDRSSYEARKARSGAMQDYLHAHPYKKSV
jgi:hypothetical protein